MLHGKTIGLVIPAHNEAAAVQRVIQNVPGWIDDIVVVNNASTDATAALARAAGARVIDEPRKGYGAACSAGVAAVAASDVVAFMDADFSDCAEDLISVVDPVARNDVDIALGKRIPVSRNAISFHQRWGNWFICSALKVFYGYSFCDLGPLRAINRQKLEALQMRDRGFGWTIEMQIKAVQAGYKILEIPVDYRPRIGQSKISGTLSGTVQAACKMFFLLVKHKLVSQQ